MIRARSVRRALLAATSLLLLAGGTASAGGFHVHIGGGGHAHWGGGGHAHWGGGFRVPQVRWGHYGHVGVRVTGGIWVGGPYYQPYPVYAQPPPPPCDCGPGGYYPPVYPAPSTTYAAPAPAEDPLPRFGVGLFAGGTATDQDAQGSDVGLLARFRLSEGLLLEGELGKAELEDSARVDRRVEGALVWELGARNAWAPYLLAGIGAQQADTVDASASQGFAEIGAGLRWAVTPRFHLTADIRAGGRDTMSDSGREVPGGVLAREVTPPPAGSNETENYTRTRLAAMIFF